MSLYSTVTVILIILGLLALAFGVFIIYTIFKSRKRLPLNLPIAYNFCPQYSKGYGVLLELDVKNLKNGRTLSTVIPRDIRQSEDSIQRELPAPLHVVCAEGRRLVISTGDGLSSNRQIIFYLPPRAEKLSRFLQETPFGQMLSKNIDREDIIKMLNERAELIRETTSKTMLAGEEVHTKLLLEKIPEIADAIVNMSKKDLDKKKDSSGSGYAPLGGFAGGMGGL